MLTINQADLFYAAEYALAALLLLLCTWQRGTLDIRRQIGRKVFFRRLLLVLFVSVLGIALMTGIYFIRLEPEVRFAAVGAVQFFMTVCNSVILGSSFFQRYRVYAIMDTNNNRRKRNDPHRVKGIFPSFGAPVCRRRSEYG